MKEKTLLCDPPMGWRFGFPLAYTFKVEGENVSKEEYNRQLEQWYLDKGYPQTLIDQGMLEYVRIFTSTPAR